MDDRLAAIDLGSNTFRLSIGRIVHHGGHTQLRTRDEARELVALAQGLDEHQRLRPGTVDGALATLQRFAEQLQGFAPHQVRAVATNTFRVARNAAEVLPRAQAALGFPIEIISGQEEARLIYLGVSHCLPASDDRRLVIDIGGGSTEFIIGRGHQPRQLASLALGCTSWTRRYFPQGRITAARFRRAILAARSQIEAISSRFRATGWDAAYGSSGTAKGLLAVLTENGLSHDGITPGGMEQLAAALARIGEARLQDWAGLKAERAPVLAGGLAIMLAAAQELGIPKMQTGDGALKIGVLYDLLGRGTHHDRRDETVNELIARYQLDPGHATRVSATALALFDQLVCAHDLETLELRKLLGWAAQLHEIGLIIARDAYHKHSAYILQHADLPGFSQDDQESLSFLALGHQGKLGKLRRLRFDQTHWHALCCLRLAVLLLRRRDPLPARLPLDVQATDNRIRIRADGDWLATHRASEWQLKAEIDLWQRAGFALSLTS